MYCIADAQIHQYYCTFVHIEFKLKLQRGSVSEQTKQIKQIKQKDAIKVAKLYYYQELTTQAIADELGVSRSKVSRLLSYAKEQGLVEIRILDPEAELASLEQDIRQRFALKKVQVVNVSESATDAECLNRVSMEAARYLNTIVSQAKILAVAWGNTVSSISKHLQVKPLIDLQVVQLNGSGNTHDAGISYSSEILRRFADSYRAKTHPFPVPSFFDFEETKAALWKERSIVRILELQERADIYLYSIGATASGLPSHIYEGDYLENQDLQELRKEKVVGDIATVFFRADGSYLDIPINARASGPDLQQFQSAKHAICVVAGSGKVQGLLAALRGGYLNTLIIDEPSARYLLTLEQQAS